MATPIKNPESTVQLGVLIVSHDPEDEWVNVCTGLEGLVVNELSSARVVGVVRSGDFLPAKRLSMTDCDGLFIFETITCIISALVSDIPVKFKC